MADADLIVVGGGISGASLAYLCAKAGLSVTVLDSNKKMGGCLWTHKSKAGYWHELGAHTCYASYGETLKLIEELPDGLKSLVARQKAPMKLVEGGQIKSLFSQINIPSLLFNAVKLPFLNKDGKTVRQFWGQVVGANNWERVFSPVFAAVPSQPADDFPASMLFKSRKKRKDVPRSFTIENGLQALVLGLTNHPNINCITSTTVKSVTKDAAGNYVVATGESSFVSRLLALAVAPDSAANLLADVNPKLSKAIGCIETCKVETIGVVINSESTQLPNAAFFIPTNDSFRSCVTRDVYPHEKYRGFAFHLSPKVSDSDAIARIEEFLGVPRDKWLDVNRHQVVLPSPKLGHAEIVKIVDQLIAGSTIAITGNWFAGLAIEDCVQRSQSQADNLVNLFNEMSAPQNQSGSTDGK